MAASSLNKNNSAVKRIMQEARELSSDPSTDYAAGPLEEWHCTLRGPAGTEFEGGLYHVRILLPAEYPFRPPSLMILTPNGRFELNTKICISFTNYHEELWQPAWGVRTAILGLQGFFPLKGQAAAGVGSVEYPASERRRLAALSRDWVCPHCQQSNLDILPDSPAGQENGPSYSIPPPVEPELAALPEHNDASPSANSVGPRSEEAEDEVAQETSLSMTESISSPTIPEHDANVLSPQPLRRPPVLLDTAICFLLVLVFALLCRKMI
ncbi:non-canonical ubiquitin conjugating enzyme 1 [Desarmillaria tabescens]|uniref:Non-canonical ubiquitin conjugating enzyme 1 n=1 Tax=Armillaria tabescens TaxID=1929756 RepID=A0AA39KEC0_ARMTA|nr:non-canonical ubiquitin conjugating enzyme 1 [Desarmillaria tabescens]KAK0459535.1 non-canonical ubiquitin conjugating enzyme 1 [Desarmillaria tabescens]